MKQIKVSLDSLMSTIEEGIQNDQTVEIKISGNSMYPFLVDQTTSVGLKKFSGELIKHHIYFFRYKDKVVLHRYIKTKDNINCFRGDALDTYETPAIDQIIAEVTYIKNNEKTSNPYSCLNKTRVWMILSKKQIKRVLKKILRRNNG